MWKSLGEREKFFVLSYHQKLVALFCEIMFGKNKVNKTMKLWQ